MVIGSWETSFHGDTINAKLVKCLHCDMSIRDTASVILSRFSAFVSADLPCLQYLPPTRLSAIWRFPLLPCLPNFYHPSKDKDFKKKIHKKTSPSHTEGASSSHPTLSAGGTAHHYLLERGHGIRTPGKAWLELQEGLESTSSATTCPGILVC